MLEKAKSMVAAKHNNKDAFLAWVASIFSIQRCKLIEKNILIMEQFAVAAKLISGSIFEVTDTATLEAIFKASKKNIFFQIKNKKLIKNINDDFISYIQYCLQKFEQTDERVLSKGESLEKPVSTVSAPTVPNISNKYSTASKEESNEIVTVLKQHYEYGFKYNSLRELIRFRQFAEVMGITLPKDDEVLRASILSSGAVIDDKVYCKSNNLPQELRRIVDDTFSSGVGVIYYDSLFERERDWMESHIIISSEMLKEYLQKSVPGCSFSKKFMVKGTRRAEKEVVTDELKRVWGCVRLRA